MARACLGRRVRAHHVRPHTQSSRPHSWTQRQRTMNDHTPALVIDAPRAGTIEAVTKIDIRDLNFYYGKSHALKDVSFAIPANSVTAIIGPSGCGKSTLLRTINRIYELYPEQYAAGSIAIDGRNVLDRRYPLSELRRKVGMVFQKPTPFAS